MLICSVCEGNHGKIQGLRKLAETNLKMAVARGSTHDPHQCRSRTGIDFEVVLQQFSMSFMSDRNRMLKEAVDPGSGGSQYFARTRDVFARSV